MIYGIAVEQRSSEDVAEVFEDVAEVLEERRGSPKKAYPFFAIMGWLIFYSSSDAWQYAVVARHPAARFGKDNIGGEYCEINSKYFPL
jgi:hypothetical protein